MNDDFATSSIIFNIRSNFMVETHIFIFYSASTFFSKLGGYYASFTALFSYLAPIFMLYFLYNLALIIKQQRRKKYVSELKLTTHRFLQILDDYKLGRFQMNVFQIACIDEKNWQSYVNGLKYSYSDCIKMAQKPKWNYQEIEQFLQIQKFKKEWMTKSKFMLSYTKLPLKDYEDQFERICKLLLLKLK